MPSINRLMLGIAGLACDVFYRQSRLGGTVPSKGPLLLVGNHPNGLIDPMLLARTTSRPVRFLAKAPLFELPVLGAILRAMRALPVYRSMDGADTGLNTRTFDAVHAALREGDVVALFPEGRSHSEHKLDPLKTGAARMALGAEASASYRLGVLVVPVGLLFQDKLRFRSRVAIWVGEPISPADLLAAHRADERAAVRALTDRIAEGLRRVTLELDAWEDLPLLELAERIWRQGAGRRVERLRALAAGAHELGERDSERLHELRGDLATFARRLERLDVSPDDLALRYTPARVAAFVARNLVALFLGLPLALAGAVLWWVPYRLAPILGRAAKPTPETYVTNVVLAGLVVFPIWYALLLVAAAVFFGGGEPARATWIVVALALAAPPLGLFSLAYWERRSQALEDLAVFFRLGLRRSLKARLVAQRDELAARIEGLAADLDQGG